MQTVVDGYRKSCTFFQEGDTYGWFLVDKESPVGFREDK